MIQLVTQRGRPKIDHGSEIVPVQPDLANVVERHPASVSIVSAVGWETSLLPPLPHATVSRAGPIALGPATYGPRATSAHCLRQQPRFGRGVIIRPSGRVDSAPGTPAATVAALFFTSAPSSCTLRVQMPSQGPAFYGPLLSCKARSSMFA